MCPLAVMWYNLFSIGCMYIENYFFFMHSTFLLFPVFTCTSGRFLFCDARRLTLHVSHFILLFFGYTEPQRAHIITSCSDCFADYALVYFVTKHTINITRHLNRVMRKPRFWFPTWSDTNQAVQLQMMARGLKFLIKKVKGLDCVCSENNGYREGDLRLCFCI